MIRVLIVDDHALMRAGFRAILTTQRDIEVVGEAADGASGVQAARELGPDVITMDVQMPGMSGIDAAREIATDPDVHAAIGIVTTFENDETLFAALDAGASGFLLKNARPEDLIAAVRTLAAGDAVLAPEVTRRVLRQVAGQSDSGQGGQFLRPLAQNSHDQAPTTPNATVQPEKPTSPDYGLTDRETEVLTLMADALSNGEIAERLFIGEATVKTHVSNVLHKLGARDRTHAVVLAHRLGLA